MAGVYVSWPFCAQKCTYCNFASGVFPDDLERRYLAALQTELSSTCWPWAPDTLYLGGGTPGSMSPGMLAELLSLIPGRPWREATIEAAPGSITPQLVEGWLCAGISRVSLGVQSFVARELRRTGRKHTAALVEREVALLRAAGLNEVNIDLIAGLPGQTPEGWRESLDWIERLHPPHVSVYMLEVDEDSRLGREMLLGGVRYGAADVPDEGLIAEFYEQAVARLQQLGIARYEISNFACPGHESLHNLKYWRLEPYLGFGADAHSFDGTTRRANVDSVKDYVLRVSSGLSAWENPTVPAHLDEERFFVGLRLMTGIRPKQEEWERFREPIGRFLHNGLLVREGDTLRLTDRGVLLSNEVFEEFLIS